MTSPTSIPAASNRWVVSVHDISAHIQGSPQAYLALVYDPAADWLLGGSVGESIDEAVASAFQHLDNPAGTQPRSLACDPRATAAVRLQCSTFAQAPSVIAATDADLLATASIFQHFVANGPPGAAHDTALRMLDEPARRFIESRCWKERADSEPLLLDVRINGERRGGVVSVMGNGGETWGISIFPNGGAFDEMMTREQPGMPADGVLTCVVDPAAIDDPQRAAVEMAVAIDGGEAEPARLTEVRLLHVALLAAAEAPAVGAPRPSTGTVKSADFEASFTVFDVDGMRDALEAEQREAAPARAAPRRGPLQFGELPREIVGQLASPEDEVAAACLASLPRRAGIPAVFIAHPTLADAKRMVRTIEAGRYLGITAVPEIGGTTIRLIGLSDPIVLGHVATMWSPLRGFMRRRETARGLHAIVIAPIDTGDPVGIFVCVLPQPASDLEKEPSGVRELRAAVRHNGGRRTAPTKRGRR